MTPKLINEITDHFKGIQDPRTGKNTTYRTEEIGMAAFSVFYLQSPSFLAHQERLKKKHATHNGETLFNFHKIPSDNHIRSFFDKIKNENIQNLFPKLIKHVNKDDFRVDGHLIVALDGTWFHSSGKICCPNCSTIKHNDKTNYHHAMLCPVLVHPEQKCAIPMSPEFITPQDGAEKQDCEINAAKRWCENNKSFLEENKTILLGDDLFCHAPFVNQISKYNDVKFIFTCKFSSHKFLETWIKSYEEEDILKVKTTETKGNQKHVFEYKIYKNVPLMGDAKSPLVNYFEVEVRDKKGKVIYKNTFATNIDIDEKNIHKIMKIGRDRWKIENEAFNVLKKKGYNLEHNFGHGKSNLSNNLILLNLIAFLVHYLSEYFDIFYKKARSLFGARTRFFETLRVILSVMVFKSWSEFWDYIIDISEKAT